MTEAEELGLKLTGDDVVVCKDPPVKIESDLDEFCTLPWARSHEKLGGWPGWVNLSTAYPKCRACKWLMTFVIFQFGPGKLIPVEFGDGGQGQLVNCDRHPRVLAYP